MEIIKNIIISILFPVAMTTLTFANQYGGFQKTLETVVNNQANVMIELKTLNNKVSTSTIQRVDDKEKIDRLMKKIDEQQQTLSSINASIEVLNTNIIQLKENSISGGPERLKRLENIVFDLKAGK